VLAEDVAGIEQIARLLAVQHQTQFPLLQFGQRLGDGLTVKARGLDLIAGDEPADDDVADRHQNGEERGRREAEHAQPHEQRE
jgi:hypothetical protein